MVMYFWKTLRTLAGRRFLVLDHPAVASGAEGVRLVVIFWGPMPMGGRGPEGYFTRDEHS